MSQNLATAQKTCRLLYYGPPNSGKRANLRQIHQSLPPGQRLALAVADPERQIGFRVNHGTSGTWQVLVQAVDTGRERYRAAGMVDQVPFDGIVFVVDSSGSRLDESLAAFESLKTYLDTWGLDLMGVPLVVQYNGRDQADTLGVDRLESLLNPWGLLSFPANARTGEGVRETLKAVLGLTVNHLETRPAPARTTEPLPDPLPPDSPATRGGGVPPVQATGPLGIEYGPPLPGAEISAETRALSEAILDELRPPVVIPVRIPRRLLQGDGPLRILLEVEVADDL